MPQLEVTINAKLDGVPIFDTPLIKRVTVTTVEAMTDVQRAAGTGYVALGDEVAAVAAFLLTADQSLGVKLSGGSNVDCTLNAGGLLLMVDGVINATAATNIVVSNLGSATANVSATVLGA